MTRWWKIRRARPTDDEIAEEIRMHVDLLGAEARASGAEDIEAASIARERFGDAAETIRQVRRVWGEESLLLRLSLFTVATALAAFVLLVAAGPGRMMTDEFFLQMPSWAVLALPMGASLGVALALVRPASPSKAGILRARAVATTLCVGAIAGVVTAAVYTAVPMANLHIVQLRHRDNEAFPPDFAGLRAANVPELRAIVSPDRQPAWMSRYAPPRLGIFVRAAHHELQKRFALPASCVVLALAGLACAAWAGCRRGAPALAASGAVLAVAVWYGVYAAAEARLVDAWWPVALLAWAPNAVVLLMACAALVVRHHAERARAT